MNSITHGSKTSNLGKSPNFELLKLENILIDQTSAVMSMHT